VTNRPEQAQELYEQLYCYRGDIENRIKELLHGLELDRTSCSRFWANQFRVCSPPRPRSLQGCGGTRRPRSTPARR
jgi:hypothetical protein